MYCTSIAIYGRHVWCVSWSKKLKKIAKHIHALATKLSEGLSQLGYNQINKITLIQYK